MSGTCAWDGSEESEAECTCREDKLREVELIPAPPDGFDF